MGYHTFYVKFASRDGTTHLPHLCKIAKKYGFSIQKDSWLSKMMRNDDCTTYFTCIKEITGFSHWWNGGEAGMEKKAKSFAWDIEQYLKQHNVCIENIQLVYLTGSVDKK
jgi:hypothetical protein